MAKRVLGGGWAIADGSIMEGVLYKAANIIVLRQFSAK